MANTDRLLGQVLGDTFRLKRRVASGTMGMIYEAEDLSRSRRVAVAQRSHAFRKFLKMS